MAVKNNRHNSQDSKRYFDWLDHSSADLVAASLLKEDDRCYDQAAFHCQQAIEKALKAYILLRSGRLYDGHNLTWLCRQAKKYHKGFQQWYDESAELNQCYIETRYPADVDKEIDYKMVQGFYTMAKDMYRFIFEQVDQELERREQAEERISRRK